MKPHTPLRYFVIAALLPVILSCTPDHEEEEHPKVSASMQEIETFFRNGEVLASMATIDDSRHRVVFASGRTMVFNDNDCGFCTTSSAWPSVLLSSQQYWVVNGHSSGHKLSETATCIVASYCNDEGLWFRKDNGEIIFFNFDELKDVGCFRFEQCNNVAIHSSVNASVNGDVATITAEELYPIRNIAKATIGVRGDSLMLDGKPYINCQSSVNMAGSVLSYRDVDGRTRTLKFETDIKRQIPVIIINTSGGAPIDSKEVYVPATITVEDDYWFYGSSCAVTATGKIRGRGNTTWDFPKKPYRLKFDSKVEFMGLPKNKDWILLANYSDKSLLRNSAALRISEAYGMPWTPRHRNAELYLNGDYKGVYMICEAIEPAKEKIQLKVSGEDDGTDLTGGYLLEVDDKCSNFARFTTVHGVPIGFKEPDEPTLSQKQYVEKYVQQVENAIYDGNPNDATNGYKAFIDIDSFVGNYLVNELTKNIDGNFRLSTFLAKHPNDNHLQVTNVWDFDLAIGNCNYFPDLYGCTNTYEGLFVWGHSHWYSRLFNDRSFIDEVKKGWRKLYPKVDGVIADVRAEAEAMEDATNRNFGRWDILGSYVWPNLYVSSYYNNNLEYMLSYLKNRAEWLNTTIESW